jgi:phospholipase C
MRSFQSFSLMSLAALVTLTLTGCGSGSSSPSNPSTQTFEVTVAAPPSGAGTITSTPAGISCPSTCSASFAQGTKVTLTATPSSNYFFAGWGGACSGMTCTLTVTAAASVTDSFMAGDGLTVAVSGSGSVTSSPPGINCPTTCAASFAPNTQITLTETPGTGDFFSGWGGTCSGTGTCTLTLTSTKRVTAAFSAEVAGNLLTVTMAGAGMGTVTSTPAGISCTTGSTATCSATFAPDTPVTLTETSATGSVFNGWSGGCTGTTGCNITLSAATGVTATFGGTLQSLNHIILFAQENRSLDHYFGYMRQYWVNNPTLYQDQEFDGLPQFNQADGINPPPGPAPALPGCDPSNPQGADVCVPDPSVTVPSFHMQSVCTEEDSPFWNESHTDWNVNFLYPGTTNPLMNGFVVASANDAREYSVTTNGGKPVNDVNGYRSMGYFTDADLNYYYFMASNFATSDRWFSPAMTRTQMNRAYIIAATSQGKVYPIQSGQPQLTAEPIFEALQNAGINWRIYIDADNTACATETGDQQSECLLEGYSYLNQFSYEDTILNSAGQNPDLLSHVAPLSQFYTDMQNDQTFPQVILIEPASLQGLDEHPSDSDQYPENIQDGAAYAKNLIGQLMTSPSWKDSVMIFTYDEGGGFYDHVQPQPVPVPDPTADQYPTDLQSSDACDGADQTSGVCSFGMTGYRIPLIVISPFTRKNYVSHVVRDTTAWLNLVEERFNIAPLTQRDAYWSTPQSGSNGQTTAQMDEFFDFVNAPWATPPSPPPQNTGGTCSIAAPTP